MIATAGSILSVTVVLFGLATFLAGVFYKNADNRIEGLLYVLIGIASHQ